jgi:hypothetical protein
VLLTMSVEKPVWCSTRGMTSVVRETARAGDPESGGSPIVQAQDVRDYVHAVHCPESGHWSAMRLRSGSCPRWARVTLYVGCRDLRGSIAGRRPRR